MSDTEDILTSSTEKYVRLREVTDEVPTEDKPPEYNVAMGIPAAKEPSKADTKCISEQPLSLRSWQQPLPLRSWHQPLPPGSWPVDSSQQSMPTHYDNQYLPISKSNAEKEEDPDCCNDLCTCNCCGEEFYRGDSRDDEYSLSDECGVICVFCQICRVLMAGVYCCMAILVNIR